MTSVTVGNNVVLLNGLVLSTEIVTSDTNISDLSQQPCILGVDTTNSLITITLPNDATRVNGRYYYIFDYGGNATNNNIIIDGNDSNISGNSQYIIQSNYNCVTLVWLNTSWYII